VKTLGMSALEHKADIPNQLGDVLEQKSYWTGIGGAPARLLVGQLLKPLPSFWRGRLEVPEAALGE